MKMISRDQRNKIGEAMVLSHESRHGKKRGKVTYRERKAKPASVWNHILTDGMEDETNEINNFDRR
jgi:hypothetical protein